MRQYSQIISLEHISTATPQDEEKNAFQLLSLKSENERPKAIERSPIIKYNGCMLMLENEPISPCVKVYDCINGPENRTKENTLPNNNPVTAWLQHLHVIFCSDPAFRATYIHCLRLKVSEDPIIIQQEKTLKSCLYGSPPTVLIRRMKASCHGMHRRISDPTAIALSCVDLDFFEKQDKLNIDHPATATCLFWTAASLFRELAHVIVTQNLPAKTEKSRSEATSHTSIFDGKI